MSFDDDLRDALRTEAGRYEPADDGLADIRTGVRAARARRRRIQSGVLAAAAVVAVIAGIGLTRGDDPTEVETDGSVATQPTTPTTETTVAPVDPAEEGVFPGIWPFASQAAIDNYADGDRRFEDPVATAEAFARDYLGMLDPTVTPVSSSDDLGEASVELRPKGEDGPLTGEAGPRTLVALRSYETSYGARVWTVVGASSPNIVLDQPASGDTVTSPLAVSGRATGYEGTVVAQVRQDGMRAGDSLGETVGIAGAGPELAPFELGVRWDTPATEPTGALLVHTDTGLSGVGVPEATVVRLAFGATPDRPGGAPCSPPGIDGEPGADEFDVMFFVTCDSAFADDPTADAAFVPVFRRVPRTQGVLRVTLEQLVAGPTAEERAAGLSSFFSSETVDVLAGVSLRDGTAVVDFARRVNNASTSAGQQAFRGALDRTVFQFPSVERIEYRLEGSCDAFWQWQQVGDCQLVSRDR